MTSAPLELSADMEIFLLAALGMLACLYVIAPKGKLKAYFLLSLVAAIGLGFYLGYGFFDFAPYQFKSSVVAVAVTLVFVVAARAWRILLEKLSDYLLAKVRSFKFASKRSDNS